MENLILNSAASGVFISLAAYGIGTLVKRKWKSALANPLLIAIILVILFLKLSGVEYETYNVSAKYLTYLLAPATVSLAIPMYERMQLLKENYAAILTGILSGVLASLVCVLAMALVFHLSQAEYVTLLPKSVTTAIGMDIAKELGGHSEIAAAVIIIPVCLGIWRQSRSAAYLQSAIRWQRESRWEPRLMRSEQPKLWRWARQKEQ